MIPYNMQNHAIVVRIGVMTVVIPVLIAPVNFNIPEPFKFADLDMRIKKIGSVSFIELTDIEYDYRFTGNSF